MLGLQKGVRQRSRCAMPSRFKLRSCSSMLATPPVSSFTSTGHRKSSSMDWVPSSLLQWSPGRPINAARTSTARRSQVRLPLDAYRL